MDYIKLTQSIKKWGKELGFQSIGISSANLPEAEKKLMTWLAAGYHGEMSYMEKHGALRAKPDELFPGTLRIVSVRMDYYPDKALDPVENLNSPEKAYISRYALARDYHKVLRRRLKKLQQRILNETPSLKSRIFVDSAPVLEKELAARSGMGWIGKHTNLINKNHGSWFFLGELFTNLPLITDTPASGHCGTCRSCIDVCPTNAIIQPYILDARKCISYLTIEYRGIIPEEFRDAIGNRIYGCDDCQIWCPWNKFKSATSEPDFSPRNQLDNIELLKLFEWTEEQFENLLRGSPIRRIGYMAWLRNISIALGNAPADEKTLKALQHRLSKTDNIVLHDHFNWSIRRQISKLARTRTP